MKWWPELTRFCHAFIFKMTKTINETYQDDYRSKQRRRWLTLWTLALLVLGIVTGGIFYALFFSRWMAVTDVAVSQQSFVGNDEIKQRVFNYLNEKKWGLVPRSSNIFLADGQSIRALLRDSFPVLKAIAVHKKYFHGLMIEATHREAVGIWCFKKQQECFYFDEEGMAFDQAADSSGTLLLMVEDRVRENKKIGEQVAEPELTAWLLRLRQALDGAKIGLAKAVIPAEQFRVDIKTTEGWEIYFNVLDDLDSQIKALTVFLANKVSFEQRSQLQYIDVRIPQRVYFK